jgi:hypothetical protein
MGDLEFKENVMFVASTRVNSFFLFKIDFFKYSLITTRYFKVATSQI